jgi:hypothetical protein
VSLFSDWASKLGIPVWALIVLTVLAGIGALAVLGVL